MPQQDDVVNFVVLPSAAGTWSVMEAGFDQPLAEFAQIDTAEQYALRMAESKPAWKVDVFDASGQLTGTFNSEDDSMPRPPLA